MEGNTSSEEIQYVYYERYLSVYTSKFDAEDLHLHFSIHNHNLENL